MPARTRSAAPALRSPDTPSLPKQPAVRKARAVQPDLREALAPGMADRRIGVLRAIAAGGSISQAARAVGVSYKAAWQALDTLSNLAGVALVDKAVGGSGGGGAALTPAGQALLAAADALDAARESVFAGLDGPAAPLLGLRTSMRNQWRAWVAGLAVQGTSVEVRLALGAPDGPPVAARITRESAELLGLRPGLAVLALCKATAVRVVAADASGSGSDVDQGLPGRAMRVSRPSGAALHEVVLALDGAEGAQVVGFAPAGTVRARARAIAYLAPEAVVIGLP